MENRILEELKERKSVRVFTEQEISEEDKGAILEAAMQAPTAGNQQLYTIIDVTDQKKKEQLAESCDHQPFIAKAKMVLVFCADTLKWHDAFRMAGCEPREAGVGDLMLAVCDALIAAQNAVTAAWSLGIGSCYIGDILENREIQKEILEIPNHVMPAAMLVFGYPTEQQRKRTKPARAELKYIVHENIYQRLGEDQLQDMLKHNLGEGSYTERLKAFCARKFNSDFSKEMSRSVAEYLKEY